MEKLTAVDCSRARSNHQVVEMAVKDLGWTIAEGEENKSESTIHWLAAPEPEVYSQVDNCKINRFPGMQEIAKKVSLTRSLNTMYRLFPDEYDFYPVSWFLPGQYEEFCSDYDANAKYRNTRNKPWFIVKPDNGAQGDGIYLISDPKELRDIDQPQLIQEYVSDPYLFKDSLKFDLRVYVVVKSVNPLNIWICKEGMVRFATEKYRPPSKGNYHQNNMHLTNFSLNKSHPNFTFGQNHLAFEGSKRLLSGMLSELKASGIDTERLWNQICGIAVKTIIAMIPEIVIRFERQYHGKDQNVDCFQVCLFCISKLYRVPSEMRLCGFL